MLDLFKVELTFKVVFIHSVHIFFECLSCASQYEGLSFQGVAVKRYVSIPAYYELTLKNLESLPIRTCAAM